MTEMFFFVAVQVCVCVLVCVCRLCVGKQEVIGSRIHHILLRSWLSPLSHVAPMPLSRDTESDILLPFPFFSPAISTRGSFCLLSLSSPLAASSAAHHPLPLHTYKWVFLLHTYTKKTCVQVQLRLQVRIVQKPVRDKLLSILQTARALEALLRVPQCPIKQKDWRWRQRPHAKLFTTAPVTPRIVGFHLLSLIKCRDLKSECLLQAAQGAGGICGFFTHFPTLPYHLHSLFPDHWLRCQQAAVQDCNLLRGN